MVCSYYSSCKWNEGRGEERVRIYEGNGNQLEGKHSCSISVKAPSRSLSPLLIPLHAIPSYPQTCYKQCKVYMLEETITWGTITGYFWSKRQENPAYYGGCILSYYNHWDYKNGKHISRPGFTQSLSSYTALL